MINRQITIRPQDIVVLIKLIVLGKKNISWLKKDLADELCLSNSEITKVFVRLQATGLFSANSNVIQRTTFYEFLIYGLKITFPPFIGSETRGVLTGVNALKEGGIRGTNYVWESYEGQHRGISVSPLYPDIVLAAKKDDLLYQALCACDMLRVGQTREVNFAREWLKRIITE